MTDLEEMNGWASMETCPCGEVVDLWCVCGDENFARYQPGGAPVGMLRQGLWKSKEHFWFGNKDPDRVPRMGQPDLLPVAWRPSAPDCPAELIAAVLGVPLDRSEG